MRAFDASFTKQFIFCAFFFALSAHASENTAPEAAKVDPAALSARLRADAEQTLQAYLTKQGWPMGQTRFETWLSPAASHLPLCQGELQLQAGALYRQPWGRRPYVISCNQPAWDVRGRVEVSLTLSVWTAAQPISKDEPLTPDDLLAKEMEVSRVQRGFIPSSENLLGAKTTRNLRMGHLLSDSDLQTIYAVHAGEGVVIRASNGQFSVSTQGIALENGAIGEAIKVKNNQSGREIQAWVSGKGEVETRF
ncbi:MAG: flagellar basal body P-ring formation chaperone FlgA [Aeromonas sp.]